MVIIPDEWQIRRAGGKCFEGAVILPQHTMYARRLHRLRMSRLPIEVFVARLYTPTLPLGCHPLLQLLISLSMAQERDEESAHRELSRVLSMM